MTREEFQEFMYSNIPLTKKMDFTIEDFEDEKISVKALLKTNINHKSTAFGGSISTVLTMCGWAAVFKIIKEIDEEAHIVIQKSCVNYIKPITKDFTALYEVKNREEIQNFIKTYNKYGKARMEIETKILENESVRASFIGTYVVYK